MTEQGADFREWSRVRWTLTIALVFGIQVAAVVWLRDRTPPPPRHTLSVPVFRISRNRSPELLALEDPTLFALPHLEGFSGKAWIDLPPPPFPDSENQQPDGLWELAVSRLGMPFKNFIQTNPPPAFAALDPIDPALLAPQVKLVPPATGPSRLELTGDLAGRKLMSAPSLPSWTNTDLLTNTVVQLVVDAAGNVLSAVLLPPGSGYEPANRFALNFGKSARFEPLGTESEEGVKPKSDLVLGAIVFEWQTFLVPLTNSVASNP